MKALIACEESQAICIEMRKLWIEAYSCDIQECSWWHPEWHIIGDATIVMLWWKFKTQNWEEIIIDKWDMMIAHPPCTYLSNAGARFLYAGGILNEERYKKWLEAKEFFMKLFNAPIKKIALENPIQSTVYGIPKYSQIIQPYYFWHPFQKKTCLWLKNLPLLQPTDILEKPESTKIAGNWFNKWGKDRQKNRSKTFPWIAKAIAEQWGILN